MNRIRTPHVILIVIILFLSIGLYTCKHLADAEQQLINDLRKKGLTAEAISAENFYKGIAPANFETIAGAPYKPSYNEEPEISPQCWVETSYGTQNACRYCHTDYLTDIKHGNAFPLAEDQILYSFPSSNLNRILWQNIIYPQDIKRRLKANGIEIPGIEDVEYVRHDNWLPTYKKARSNGNSSWLNTETDNEKLALFPALNPQHLYPYKPENPTNNGNNGYVDKEGFVRSEQEQYTGWRAINFFPYALFTPLTGSVSGIYIRLPEEFMTNGNKVDIDIYKKNLTILEKNIKNQECPESHYAGNASGIEVKKGFYPVGTEFAHPLHYVDLLADGDFGSSLDGAITTEKIDYEFPGTRSKRVKEIRYMYKWREVGLEDIGEEDEENGFGEYIGQEGQGWIDNEAGWILAAYIENSQGELRPQTTEELAQCLGCHSKVGNTIDAVWSFQRKIPGLEGWAEMNYGSYNSKEPTKTKLQDYLYESTGMGELGYFYYTVVGADLYGVMPQEINQALKAYAKSINFKHVLGINFDIHEILDDDTLKQMDRLQREPRLLARQKLMRHYSEHKEYLTYNDDDDKYYIKGNVFYPNPETMKANIHGYRKIVLDQSYNLGKDVFGSESEHVPFTFRSDGTVKDEDGQIIAVGEVIYSRPYDENGEGTTPTGIIKVNEDGEAVDVNGNIIDPLKEPEKAIGHISTGGTYDVYYNPILSGKSVR
ncbi:MAG: hypothetical protein ACLFNU_12700 [Bacteroidales bacterium]